MKLTTKRLIVFASALLFLVLLFSVRENLYGGNHSHTERYKTVILTNYPTTNPQDQQQWFQNWLNADSLRDWRFCQLVPSNGQNMPFQKPMVILEHR